jgi:Tfp pilus assembly protein PilF
MVADSDGVIIHQGSRPPVRPHAPRAKDLDKNYAPGWHWYAMHLSLLGRHDEAISAIRRAEELDPVSLVINSNHGWILWCARRNDEAIAQLRQT